MIVYVTGGNTSRVNTPPRVKSSLHWPSITKRTQAAVVKISAPNAILGCKATAKAAHTADQTGQWEANSKTDITRIIPASLGCQYEPRINWSATPALSPVTRPSTSALKTVRPDQRYEASASFRTLRLSRKTVNANIKAAITKKYRK